MSDRNWKFHTGGEFHEPIAPRIGAGTVYINNCFASVPQSPVGGFKASGYGRENGTEEFLAFTQTKSVWLDLDPYQAEPFS